MNEPKETKPESPNALRDAPKSIGEHFHEIAAKLVRVHGAGIFAVRHGQCNAVEQAALEDAAQLFRAMLALPDTSTESGLPSAGVDSITIPFPKPTKPTKLVDE